MYKTYSNIYLHVIFSTSGRECLILNSFREDLLKYICGIVNNRAQKILAINCMPDHVHILFSIEPHIRISDVVKEIKRSSSKFINDKKDYPGRFSWQEGFGVFSYSRSQLDKIIKYINRQEQHHKKLTFREEYSKFLDLYEKEYNKKHLTPIE